MRKFFRWLFGTGSKEDIQREWAKAMEASPPVAEISKPVPVAEEAKWPDPAPLLNPRIVALRAAIDADMSMIHKPKAPRRVANARPATKSKTNKRRKPV